MANTSNNNGRALEYRIAQEFITNFSNPTVNLQTQADQTRDSTHFNNLPANMRTYYDASAQKIYKWALGILSVSNTSTLDIQRLTDAAAVKGDVTDIRLTSNSNLINLSIKHNHSATKHQRPSPTPKQCGFKVADTNNQQFIIKYKKIGQQFHTQVNNLAAGTTTFSDLKKISPSTISNHIYKPMCALVTDFLNQNCTPPHAQQYFSFLIGNTDFYKIKVDANSTEISEFKNLTPVNKMHAKCRNCPENNYIDITFSNGWEVSMRLHTASSKITPTISLKFDSQLVQSPVKKRTL